MAKIPFLAFYHYHGNQNFSPCFKLSQNLSSCRVSEKSTYLFGRNDGINIQTDKFCIFSDMPPGIKLSQDGGEGIIKREVAKIPFLAFFHYHGNHFAKFFSPCFKLGQNLSSCRVSE